MRYMGGTRNIYLAYECVILYNSKCHNSIDNRIYLVIGTLNYSWGESERMSLFLPVHASQASLAALETRDPMLRQALLDACDDYIAVYLT